MTNIVKFPDSGRSHHAEPSPADEADSHAPLGRHWVWSATRFLLAVVRIPVFLVLYWLRTPLVLICSFLSIPMLLLCLFAWYAFPAKPQMYWSFGIVSFTAFVVMYSYDLVLAWLSPQEMVRTL